MAKIKGIKKAIQNMKSRSDEFSGRKPKIYNGISQDATNSIKRNFNAGGRPKWQKRKKAYSHPILDKTGSMRDSAESSALVWHFKGETYTIKIMTPKYGAYHQYGTSKLPIRAFVLFQQNEITKMKERFRKSFLRK